MNVLVTFIQRRGTTSVEKKPTQHSVDRVRIGRGGDNEIHLTDPRINLHQAVIEMRGKSVMLEAATGVDFTVDGKTSRLTALTAGQTIQIGPYDLVIEEVGEENIALTVEFVRPIPDTLETLRKNSKTSLVEVKLRNRPLAWLLAFTILGAFLIWPGFHWYMGSTAADGGRMIESAGKNQRSWIFTPDVLWLSGEMSGPHRIIGNTCKTCHEKAFVQVQDSACLACHTSVKHHTDPHKFSVPEFASSQCQDCHKEHMGVGAITRNDQSFCGDCHGKLRERFKTDLFDASNFHDNHPEFRPTVVANVAAGKFTRSKPDRAMWPKEKSNLKFPHDIHLASKGIAVPGEKRRKVLSCGDCHQPEPGGAGMRPIEMEKNCAACHPLTFDKADETRSLPHGNATATLQTITEYYGNRALRGEFGNDYSPSNRISRRLPGGRISEKARQAALSWAAQKITDAKKHAFGKAICGLCHIVSTTDQPGAPNAASGSSVTDWKIDKVLLADRWLKKGQFSHVAHRDTACIDCHGATKSKSAEDVLLPGIATCKQCHGSEAATQKVPSTCIMCHKFHLPQNINMGKPQSAGQKVRKANR